MVSLGSAHSLRIISRTLMHQTFVARLTFVAQVVHATGCGMEFWQTSPPRCTQMGSGQLGSLVGSDD